LADAGIEPSVGSVGDSYDNAQTETINGLFMAEVIHCRGLWRSFEAVEHATLEWVDWFNSRRLFAPIGTSRPPRLRPTSTPLWKLMRDEFLNETLFRNLAHARDLIAAWVTDYNTERPHSALGYQTPAGFALHLTTAIARLAAGDEGSARRAIAQPTPKGVNQQPAPVAAG
jgi:putative transposase